MHRGASLPEVAYYTVTNAEHYPGAVALLNSLRLLGEDAPFVIVDCGMTSMQRDKLASHAHIVPQSGDLHPAYQKPTGPLAYPAEIMVILDADVIVNRPLTPLYEPASRGKIVVWEERIPERFFSEWSSVGLGPARYQPYVNSGHFILSAATAPAFWKVFVEVQDALDQRGTRAGGADGQLSGSYPFFFCDQDVFNAMLCTRYYGRAFRVPRRLWAYPPFAGLAITGLDTPLCTYSDGVAPYLLHHFEYKPWIDSLKPTVYSELLTRLVTAPDAPVRLEQRDLPLRLRTTALAPLDRWRASLKVEAHQRLRGKLGIRPVLERQLAKARSRVRDTVIRPR